jgi:hypothetical protein
MWHVVLAPLLRACGHIGVSLASTRMSYYVLLLIKHGDKYIGDLQYGGMQRQYLPWL